MLGLLSSKHRHKSIGLDWDLVLKAGIGGFCCQLGLFDIILLILHSEEVERQDDKLMLELVKLALIKNVSHRIFSGILILYIHLSMCPSTYLKITCFRKKYTLMKHLCKINNPSFMLMGVIVIFFHLFLSGAVIFIRDYEMNIALFVARGTLSHNVFKYNRKLLAQFMYSS